MPYNPAKLNFISQDNIDKVVYNNRDTPLSYAVVTGGSSTQTVPNSYGQKAKITLAWSVDGTNYYPAQAYTTAAAPYTANGWCDASTVYIYMENFSGSTQTFRIVYALDTLS